MSTTGRALSAARSRYAPRDHLVELVGVAGLRPLAAVAQLVGNTGLGAAPTRLVAVAGERVDRRLDPAHGDGPQQRCRDRALVPDGIEVVPAVVLDSGVHPQIAVLGDPVGPRVPVITE